MPNTYKVKNKTTNGGRSAEHKHESNHWQRDKVCCGNGLGVLYRKMNFYFLANRVSDTQTKKAVLFRNLPIETYRLANNLVAPAQLRDDAISYDVIVQ